VTIRTPVLRAADLKPFPAVFRHLRFTPFETSSHEGRAAERYRLAAWATLTNLLARALSMTLMVLGIHFAATYLGVERLGIWATFGGLAASLSFLDLGIGNALVNRVAQASALSDARNLQRVVTGGLGVLAIVSGIVSAGLLIGVWLTPWSLVFKLTDAQLTLEATRTAIVFALLFGVFLLSTGFLKVLIGQQRAWEAHLVSAGATGAACVSLYLAVHARVEVPGLLLATFGTQSIVSLTAGVLLFKRGLICFRESSAAVNSERSYVLRTGALFFVLQIGTMIGWGADSLLVASLQGAAEVAVYAVAQRMFQFASQPLAVVNAPLWAAYADARARSDIDFIRRTLSRSVILTLLAGLLLSAILLVISPYVIPAWTGNTVNVPLLVLGLFAIWTVIEATGNALAMYLNGCGLVRPQVIVVTAFCIVVIPLKVMLGHLYGLAGVLSATIIAYLLTVVGLYATVLRRVILAPLLPLSRLESGSAP